MKKQSNSCQDCKFIVIVGGNTMIIFEQMLCSCRFIIGNRSALAVFYFHSDYNFF